MLFWNNANTVANSIWAFLESVIIICAPMVFISRKFSKIEKRLDKINYAIFNDGKTGLVNKVDTLIENQQQIKIDVEVMKAKTEGE
jgi:uncharacterized membrane protein YvbJ